MIVEWKLTKLQSKEFNEVDITRPNGRKHIRMDVWFNKCELDKFGQVLAISEEPEDSKIFTIPFFTEPSPESFIRGLKSMIKIIEKEVITL